MINEEDIGDRTEGVGDQTLFLELRGGKGIPPLPVWKYFFPSCIFFEEEALVFNITPLQKLSTMREPFLRDDMVIIWKKCKKISSRKIILPLCSTTVIFPGSTQFYSLGTKPVSALGRLSPKKLLILNLASRSHLLFHPFTREQNLSIKNISQGPQLIEVATAPLTWLELHWVTLAEVLRQYLFHC